jgi:hypothetical protein
MKKNITMTQSEAFEKFPYAVAADGDYTVMLCESPEEQEQALADWQEENEDAYATDSDGWIGPSCGLNGTADYVDAFGNSITITDDED